MNAAHGLVEIVLKLSLVLQVNVTHIWTAVAAAIVAFSFIFKSAIATMFDSVVFLFVVHAFDVGDGILINGDLHKVRTHRSFPWRAMFLATDQCVEADEQAQKLALQQLMQLLPGSLLKRCQGRCKPASKVKFYCCC